MDEIEKLKNIFLSDVDEETYEENLKDIIEWEQSILQSEAFISWQEHDITKQIMKKAREQHRANADKLSTDRTLTTAQRESIFSKQDALSWMFNLVGRDAKGEIQQVRGKIKEALIKSN